MDLTPPGVAQGVPLTGAPGTEMTNPQMETLIQEVSELRQKVLGKTTPVEQTSPFAEEVMQDDMRGNYQPPRIANFDGTGDPNRHLSRFRQVALLHKYSEGLRCRVFCMTLVDKAQQWFEQLPQVRFEILETSALYF